jgi:Carboxypeptidase regulatory-like domain
MVLHSTAKDGALMNLRISASRPHPFDQPQVVSGYVARIRIAIAKLPRRWDGSWRMLLPVLSALLCLSGMLSAQVDTGTISGRVVDATGAVISGAAVTVTGTLTGNKASTTSNADGDFTFRSLPVGKYNLEVHATGFAPYKIADIVLDVSQTLNFAAKLPVSTSIEEVTVLASSVSVDTETSTIQAVVNQEAVSSLPLNGRNPADLMFTVSGVASPVATNAPGTLDVSVAGGDIPGETVASVHGSRVGGVYFSLDGGTNVDPSQVSGGPFPNPDATSEFAVQTSSNGARFVSAPGGAVNIVTRSGTNKVHGSVFEFLRNPAVNASNYFQGDYLKRNQFGGALAGRSSTIASSCLARIREPGKSTRPLA